MPGWRGAEGACGDLDCAHRRCWREEAHVTELTGLLRDGPAADQLGGWPATMRISARRERPHPGAQLTLFEAGDGWRYTLWVTNRPASTTGWLGQPAYIDAAHRVHARAGDAALPHPARRRPADPQRPPAPPQHPGAWPWAADIVTAWDRISALPQAP